MSSKLQDKIDSEHITWNELMEMFFVKFISIKESKKAKWVLSIGSFLICMNLALMVLFLPYFYKDTKVYSVPGDIVRASHFTQYEDYSTTLNALSVHDEYSNNWISYLSLKSKYGEALQYMEQDKHIYELSGDTKDGSGKTVATTNVNEMVTAAYIAASKEAGKFDNYTTKYVVAVIPSEPEGSAILSVQPGDEILLVNGKPINSRSNLDYLTATNVNKELKISRLGEEMTINSSLYGAFIKVDNQVNDKRALQESVKLFDGNYTGNSAGLAISVELYNQFNGDIVKGRNISVTGAIDAEGRVEPVGGIPAKTILAEENGSDIMFVPFDDELANNYSDANKVNKVIGSDMKVIPVSSLHEVIEYLTNN